MTFFIKNISTFFKCKNEETFALFRWNKNKLWRFPVKNHDSKPKKVEENLTLLHLIFRHFENWSFCKSGRSGLIRTKIFCYSKLTWTPCTQYNLANYLNFLLLFGQIQWSDLWLKSLFTNKSPRNWVSTQYWEIIIQFEKCWPREVFFFVDNQFKTKNKNFAVFLVKSKFVNIQTRR